MTNNTIPNVPRELLERTIDRLKYGHEHDKALRELRAILATAKSAAADDERMRFDLWAEQQGWPKDHTMLHELWLAWKAGALLSAPSPAGVDGLEVVGTLRYFMDYPDSPHSAPGYITHQFNPASWDHAGEAAGEHKLCRLSGAQAIIDGLRGEVADLRSMLATVSKAGLRVRTERDQQAQRIGELEGLLRAESARVDFLDAYIVTADAPDTGKAAMLADSGTLRECIDAALSAGKSE